MPDTVDDAQEHPIIFNDWSITRILAGEKTQTRRVIDFSKFDPLGQMDMSPGKFEFEALKNGRSANFREPNGGAVVHCPYGQSGDELWVREAFRLPEEYKDRSPTEYLGGGSSSGWVWRFEADGAEYRGGEFHKQKDRLTEWWGRLRPAIHMPRELCRLRLRVEGVRVERVQNISDTDAAAEGIPSMAPQEASRIPAFKRKWNDIHGDGAWERNDWVWVIEFARYDE